ncbi:HORMA domain-containing protein 1 [Chanos chanos]|uniref:HORMA domain-containing protein 1 n=1 Tax=Chanos chanos TaxID=29144 RepID=A0A6J2W9Z6_CHACN|nr:HORMA domain-containing protein 1 [Chanos chanos]
MACEQRVRPSRNAQLLPDEVSTEQQSLTLVKKLLAIAVSSITYLRGLFPEKAYGTKYVDEHKVMILREERDFPGASQIVKWMQGCFDALTKKYLRMVILSMYSDPENPQKITECYQFKIQYTDKGPLLDFESTSDRNNRRATKMPCNDIKKASILLVRKLYVLMQNLGPLPDRVCLNMKLSYYDEVTPQEYQPPGFKEGDSNTMFFEKEPVSLTMGEVSTPFHSLRVEVTTERERLEQVEDKPGCMRDGQVLKMEEEEVVSEKTVNEEWTTKNDINGYVIATEEIQESHNEELRTCKDFLENLPQAQMETDVKNTDDCEVAKNRTTRSRVIRSCSERKTESTVTAKKKISPFEFPLSQDPQPEVTKRRKVSEPKEPY